MNMDPSLSDLVHTYSNLDGVSIASYTTLFGIKKKFNIPSSKFGEFIDKYSEISFSDEQEDEGLGVPPRELCLAESFENKNSLPLIGNFVFKFQVEEGEEERSYYGEDLPMRIIQCYQKAMSELLFISKDMSEYYCCVLEGHSYRKGEYVNINLRIQFPFCQVDVKFIKKIFRPFVEKLLRQNKVSEAFETQPIGDWHDHIVDFENAVPMYRSTSEPNTPHLYLVHIYHLIDDSHIKSEIGPSIELNAVFSPQNHSFIYNGKVPPGSVPLEMKEGEDVDEFKRYWLPLFLSIHFWSRDTVPKEIDIDKGKRNVYEVASADSDNPVRMAMALLPLLSVERANKDYSWLDVGKVLYNITNGGDDGLGMWINFSARATVQGRDKGMCTFRYPELKDSHLSVNTLAWYAKEDSPAAYQDWHTNWCQKALNESLSKTHADVARSLYRFFWLRFVYSNDSQTWYEYRGNHYYKLGKEPITLRKAIIEDFISIFNNMREELCSQNKNTNNYDPDNKDGDYRIKSITNLVLQIKNEHFRSTIIKAAKDFFNVEEFERKCDRNHFLTATKNCVLEVVDKRVRARPGKPEDFILKFSNIDYPMNYNWDSYWVKEVLHWFDMITVGNRDLKHYFLKRISSFLRGLNPEKLFDVWTNSGNGGKSMLAKTLQTMFGSYFVDFPVSLLTGGNKNSSGPSPELAQAANARGAILSEPDDRESMKGGIIKRITGGDRIFTRALNDNGGSMELTFKTIMICNRIPDIANVDKALINRFVIMPFLGTFSEDAPNDIEEQFRLRQFKIDQFFESKIPELARALLWISVQYYHYYATEGLLFPDIVKEYIKKHWEDNDYYLQFIDEKIEYAYLDNDKKEYDINSTLTASDIYQIFQRWFKDYYPGMPVPSLSQFKSDISMSGRLGPCGKKNSWVGIKLNTKSLVPELGGGLKI